MTIRTFLYFSLIVIYSAVQAQENKPVLGKQPNIIFILTDDLRYGDVGVFFQNERKKRGVKLSKPGLILYEGFIKMPTDGKYTIYLTSGSGAILRIHDMLVIDTDFDYK